MFINTLAEVKSKFVKIYFLESAHREIIDKEFN